MFSIEWTKAHTGTTDGNNYADKKAKEAAKAGKRIAPQSLLTHGPNNRQPQKSMESQH